MKFSEFDLPARFPSAAIISTGNKRRAWRLPLDSEGAYALITGLDGSNIPSPDDTLVLFGMYLDENSDGRTATLLVEQIEACLAGSVGAARKLKVGRM